MSKQIIISIGREYGSAGHEIAEKIAEDLNLPLYDRKLLDEVAKKHGMDPKELEKYDEKPRNFLLSRSVNGFSNSIHEAVAELQFQYLKEKAASGESFVVVGRCAEIALAEYEGLISFFILGNREQKAKRIMEKFQLSKEQALEKMNRHDKARKTYHNAYSKIAWGDSRGYDMCLNSSKIGIDRTVKLIEACVKERM